MFNILFNWCDSLGEPFCHDKNEQIIDLEIIQKEGCFASAKITLRNQVIKYRYAKVFLKEEDEIELLFFGKVISFPLVIDGSQMKIELLAEPDNYQQQLDEFISNCNEKIKVADLSQTQSTPIVRDELFFSNFALNNPTTFLEGENNIFYWDKQTGKLSLSSINKGKNTFNLSRNDIIKNSLKVNFPREPYGRININLSAEWIQNIYGFVDLVPVMSRLFSFNKINSFTDLSSSFPNFSKDGYYVAYKRISKINPNNLGVLTNYPTASSPITIKGNDQRKSIQFRRFYFDGKFIVNWEYQQKRKEEVSLSVVDKKYSRSKNITINLNAIQSSKDYPQWRAYHNYYCEDKVIYKGFIYECIKDHITDNSLSEKYWKKIDKVSDALTDDTLSSFFATERGKNCIKYAI